MTEEKRKTGFAAMDPAKVRELAGRGGKAAHEKGVARKWTSEDARAAGRLGGRAGKMKRDAAKSIAAAPVASD